MKFFQVKPAFIADIQFIGSKMRSKRMSLDSACVMDQSSSGAPELQTNHRPGSSSVEQLPTLLPIFREPASEEEQKKLFETAYQAKRKSGIFKMVKPYADSFVPVMDREDYPKPLSELYNPALLTIGYLDLLKECEKTFSSIKVYNI